MPSHRTLQPNLHHSIQNVGIIGCGIMGGSIALAAHHAGLDVVVHDCDEETLLRAADLGLRTAQTPAAACADRDVVILAAPVDALSVIAPMIKPFLEPGTIVTEIGSVKGPVRGLIEALSTPHVAFVPSHPMMGSERTGFQHADAHLLDGCTWLVCPTSKDDSANRLTAFIETIKAARVISWPLENHDVAVAIVSHLPQLAASLLASTIGDAEQSYSHGALNAAGGGFRDTTRIAESQLSVWKPIIDGNRVMLATLLDDLAARTAKLAQSLRNGDLSSVDVLFSEAHDTRSRWRETLPETTTLAACTPQKVEMWRDDVSGCDVWLEGVAPWRTVRTTAADPLVHAGAVARFLAERLGLTVPPAPRGTEPNHVRVAESLRTVGASLAEKETWSADGLSIRGVVVADEFYIIA